MPRGFALRIFQPSTLLISIASRSYKKWELTITASLFEKDCKLIKLLNIYQRPTFIYLFLLEKCILPTCCPILFKMRYSFFYTKITINYFFSFNLHSKLKKANNLGILIIIV